MNLLWLILLSAFLVANIAFWGHVEKTGKINKIARQRCLSCGTCFGDAAARQGVEEFEQASRRLRWTRHARWFLFTFVDFDPICLVGCPACESHFLYEISRGELTGPLTEKQAREWHVIYLGLPEDGGKTVGVNWPGIIFLAFLFILWLASWLVNGFILAPRSYRRRVQQTVEYLSGLPCPACGGTFGSLLAQGAADEFDRAFPYVPWEQMNREPYTTYVIDVPLWLVVCPHCVATFHFLAEEGSTWFERLTPEQDRSWRAYLTERAQ